MSNESDPRIFFAAERTLLAWLRTGLTVIGLGFIVARFGLVVRLIRSTPELTSGLPSSLIGVGLVLLGAIMIATAAWQHTRFLRQLTDTQRPTRYWLTFGVWVSALVSALGVILAVYLLWSINADA